MAPVPSNRPTALVTAPFRGPGVERLAAVADLVVDPWLDHRPLRLYGAEQLAERIDAEGATIVVCEGDVVAGPVLERPLVAIGSARGDPTNVDVAAATAAGIPVLHAPGRNADAVAELTVGLLLAVTRHIVPADRDVREGEVYRDGTIPYQRFRAWQLAGRTARAGRASAPSAGPCAGGSRASACGSSPPTPTPTTPPTRSTTCWPRPTSCRCTPRSPPTPWA